MNRNDTAEMFKRVYAQQLRGYPRVADPRDLKPIAEEWYRELEHINLPASQLGDRILAECRYWPTLPELLEIVNLIELPPRRTEGCCEDGWVVVAAWPKNLYKPCPSCFAAAYNAWSSSESDYAWWDVPA